SKGSGPGSREEPGGGARDTGRPIEVGELPIAREPARGSPLSLPGPGRRLDGVAYLEVRTLLVLETREELARDQIVPDAVAPALGALEDARVDELLEQLRRRRSVRVHALHDGLGRHRRLPEAAGREHHLEELSRERRLIEGVERGAHVLG